MTTADTLKPAILVVDDNPANLIAMQAVLGSLDARIIIAESGEEALRLMANEEFALVFLDVHMPGLDGYETLTRIREHEREREREVPAIFLTAVYDQPEQARRGYALGALDFISKPFDSAVLVAKAAALLSCYRQAQAAERRHRDETDRLQELFVAIVGHDLRNPLQTIQMTAAAMKSADHKDNANHAAQIERASNRMQRIIDDLLDLTRGRLAGGIPVVRRVLPLAAICSDVVDESRVAHPDRDLRLVLSGDLSGEWDSDRLAQVVSNLVSNAIEHGTDPVTVTAVDEGDVVCLQVHNGGAAIPGHALPTLFDAFHRNSHSRRGLGLGLYIVREVVRAHGGTVDVTSTRDGTTFRATLPKYAVTRSVPQPSPF